MDRKKVTLVNLCTGKLALLSLLAAALLVPVTNISALAQISSASISGRVEDPSGAAIPEAMITVTSLETGSVRTVTADAGGGYRVVSLPVGRYELKAEKGGFKAAVQTGIELVVGQQGVVNLKLEVGTVSEQVTVPGEAPIVNTTTSSVSGLVGEKEVKELPLNGRSFDQLILLNAGTVNYTAMRPGGAGTPQGNRFSVAGRRTAENYFLFNGVELAGPNLDITIPWGVSGQLLGVDSVREFNMQTDTYGAEYGKRPGAQVSIVTSSGTNQLHGSLFEFLRNSVLDARNFFDRASVPAYKRNQFGGSAGGPIKKDKTFIFGNYEGLRHRLGLSVSAQVPDQNTRSGLLPDGTPVLGLVRAMLPYLDYWPAANGPSLGGGVARYFASPAEAIREDYGTLRLDHSISGKDSLSGNYTIDDGFKYSPLIGDPLFADNVTLRSQTFSLQETHIFSPTTINVFTAGLSRSGYFYFTPAVGSFSSSIALLQGSLPGLISVGSGTGGGGSAGTVSPAGPLSPTINGDNKTVFTYQDQIQIVRGKHQISAGGFVQRLRDNQIGASNQLGRAVFQTLTTFLQGTVQSFQVIPNPTARTWRQWQGAWFLQDNVQLRPNLNLRVGLRHEFSNGWHDPTGRAANFVYDSNGPIVTNPLTGDTPLTENNAKKLFSPRIGLAWDPFSNGKTSVRAGFGTYYWVQDNLTSITRQVPPFNGSVTFLNQPFLSLVPVNPNVPVPAACTGGPGVPTGCSIFASNGFQPTYKTPTVQEWSFSVEQQITPNMNLRLSYVGSEAYHEFAAVEADAIPAQICANAAGCVSGGLNGFSGANPNFAVNAAGRSLVPQGVLYIPVQPLRPNPNLANGFNWRAEGNASYNALQVEVKQRFSHGLEFRGNYTWSKSIDTASGSGTGNGGVNEPQNVINPDNLGMNRGLDGHDFTHQASISGSYELPMGQGKAWLNGSTGVGSKLVSGWQLNWITSLVSGFPITPLLGFNLSGNGDLSNPDRPSWNPTFTGPVVTRDPNRWFNPAAFIAPVSGTWGNVGRGALRGPGLANLDLSLFKTTTLTERLKLQFRAEFFNVLNHTNFGNVNNVVFSAGQLNPGVACTARGTDPNTGAATPTCNPSTGVISTTSTSSRQIQFGLKLNF